MKKVTFIFCVFVTVLLSGCLTTNPSSSYHNHAYFPVETKNSTCIEKGYQIQVCKICGDRITVELGESSHNETSGTVIQESSCSKNGTIMYTCSTCGETFFYELPKLDHSYSLMNVNEGICQQVCMNCGKEEFQSVQELFLSMSDYARILTPSGSNNSSLRWSIGEYVDEFGFETGDYYIYSKTKGKFSNSATTNSPAYISIIVNPENIWIEIKEYDSSNACVAFSEYRYVEIRIRNSDGSVKTLFSNKPQYGTTRIILSPSKSVELFSRLANGDSVPMVIYVEGGTIDSSYNFILEGADLFDVYAKVFWNYLT